MKLRLYPIIIHSSLFVLSILCIIPMVLVVSASLSEETSIALHGYTIIPRDFSWFAYEYILSDPTQILNAYGVTTFVTVIGTFFSLLFSASLAYALSRKHFMLRNPISFYVFFTMLFNGGLVPSYILVTQVLDLKNSYGALILPYLVVPWFVLLLRTYFADIPEALIESAKIEGAGELRIFFGIVLPLSLPALATIGLFTALMYWNDWWLALLYVDSPDRYPLQYLLYTIMENVQAIRANPVGMNVQLPGESARMAIAVLATGPIVLAFLFTQKYFVKGLTVGAVKG